MEVKNNPEEGAGNKVCKGIRELEEMRKAEGALLMLLQLVRDGLLTLSVGAQRAGMSENDFKTLLAKE